MCVCLCICSELAVLQWLSTKMSAVLRRVYDNIRDVNIPRMQSKKRGTKKKIN